MTTVPRSSPFAPSTFPLRAQVSAKAADEARIRVAAEANKPRMSSPKAASHRCIVAQHSAAADSTARARPSLSGFLEVSPGVSPGLPLRLPLRAPLEEPLWG